MGREIRMVPPNWKHPTNDRGNLQPMYDRYFGDEFAEWLTNFDRIRAGNLDEIERECYSGDGKICLAEWLRDEGTPPDPFYYRPWKNEEATWVQVWETVSEGTPMTPPFATREELIEYLVQHGDFWNQRRGNGGYSRKQASAFVASGWVPSAVIVGGRMATGIAVASAIDANQRRVP